jgi:hypothetical protein
MLALIAPWSDLSQPQFCGLHILFLYESAVVCSYRSQLICNCLRKNQLYRELQKHISLLLTAVQACTRLFGQYFEGFSNE